MAHLFTNHDKYHIHKTLGLLAFCNFILRIYYAIVYGTSFPSFESKVFSGSCVLIHALLPIASLTIPLPEKRNFSGPMIWKEFQLHSILFSCRHVLLTLITLLELWPTQSRAFSKGIAIMLESVIKYLMIIGFIKVAAVITEKYGEERRTEIIDKATDLNIEDMIKEEDMVLTITHNQYIKRTSVSTYKSQRRGGRGVQGQTAREEDFTEHLFVENTHSYILFFTDKGKCYWVKVYDIPEGGRAAKGRAIVNLIGCEPDEKVSAFIGVKQDQFHDDHIVVMATEKGIVKKTKLSAYSNPRKKGIYALY